MKIILLIRPTTGVEILQISTSFEMISNYFGQSKKKLYTVIVVSICAVACLVLLGQWTDLWSWSGMGRKNYKALEYRHAAKYDDGETAFVFGANGIYSTYELFKCMASIESLSSIAGWAGPVYLLIDQTSCLDRELISSFPNKNIHVIKVNKDRRRLRNEFWDENVNVTSRNLLNQQPFQRAMAVKTHLLDFLPSNIKYAAWYDCDILFIKPGCVKGMLDNKPPITKEKPLFVRQDNFVGMFVAKAGESNHALEQWREKLLQANHQSALGDGEAVPDNIVFSDLFGYNSSDPSAHFGIVPPEWKDAMPPSIPNNGSIYWNSTMCALHLSNGRCNHLGLDNIDRVVQGFHLKSTMGRKWCPSIIRRKFKNYGVVWPFC